MESSWWPKSFRDFSLDFFAGEVAAFRPSVYRNCKSDDRLSCSKALNVSVFARIAFLTSWFHQDVLFSHSSATLSCFYPQLSAADKLIADLNSSHSLSMSLDTSESCLNLGDILDANCFLTSLSSKSLPFDPVSQRQSVGFPVWPRFWKSQGTYYQKVISWQFSTSLHSNVQHIRKQIWRNYAKIYQRFLIHTRSMPYIVVNLSVLEKGIHDPKSVATTELQ